MKLYMPTKVYNEKGCVRQHSQELAALGTKALLVTGRHSSRVNGSLQDVEDALNLVIEFASRCIEKHNNRVAI